MKNIIFLSALGLLSLAGCTQQVAMGGAAAAVYLTRPSSPSPADKNYRIPEHQTWCYRTMADPQCFSAPQDVPPGRLINVDPPELFPLTTEAYNQELAGNRDASTKAADYPEKLSSSAGASAPDEGDIPIKTTF